MDIYRVMVVRGEIRRVIDLPATHTEIVTQEASRDGWQVSYMLLPTDAELLPGILEEPVDLLLN